MNKTGLVVKADRRVTILMTSTGEFVKIKKINNVNVGETITGDIIKDKSYPKYLAAAILTFFIILSGGGVYAYCTPVATVQVSINPSIEIKLNRFDRIISVVPLNDDGHILVKNLKIKNMNMDEGLIKVLEKAEEDKFIDEEYMAEGNIIKVQVNSKKYLKINMEKFKEIVDKKNIDTEITVNGEKQLKVNEDKVTKEKESQSRNKINEDKNTESTDQPLKDSKNSNKHNDSQEDINNSNLLQNRVNGDNPEIPNSDEKGGNEQSPNSNTNNEDISNENEKTNKQQNRENEGTQKNIN